MKPSCSLLLAYLRQHGSITPLESVKALGIMALSQRVGELRKLMPPNEMIESRIIRTETGKRVAEYSLFRVLV